MTQAPAQVLQLVETFDRNIDVYRSGAYNETQARREFPAAWITHSNCGRRKLWPAIEP
jgi:hypothetical protein